MKFPVSRVPSARSLSGARRRRCAKKRVSGPPNCSVDPDPNLFKASDFITQNRTRIDEAGDWPLTTVCERGRPRKAKGKSEATSLLPLKTLCYHTQTIAARQKRIFFQPFALHERTLRSHPADYGRACTRARTRAHTRAHTRRLPGRSCGAFTSECNDSGVIIYAFTFYYVSCCFSYRRPRICRCP